VRRAEVSIGSLLFATGNETLARPKFGQVGVTDALAGHFFVGTLLFLTEMLLTVVVLEQIVLFAVFAAVIVTAVGVKLIELAPV
jgi:hypothetical protein